VIDGELAHYFAHFDLEELRRQQVAFLEVAFGGPYPYERATLQQAHWSLRISGREFGLVIDHFAAALRACSVSEMLAAEVLERIATLRDEVVDADR
jgi:hemoglobin